MSLKVFVFAICLTWLTASCSIAQDAYWSSLEPLVDAKTLAVVHLAKNDKFGPVWKELGVEEGRPYDSFGYMLTTLHRLTEARIDDITIVLRYESSRNPLLIAYRESDHLSLENARKLVSDFGFPIDVVAFNGWVLMGSTSTIGSVQAGKLHEPLGHWEPALQSVAGDDLQIVIAPNDDQRKVLAELTPESSSESVRSCVAGIQAMDWASIGISNPEALNLRISWSGTDQLAIPKLQQGIESLKQMLIALTKSHPQLSSLHELIGLLQFTSTQNRLVFNLAENPAVVAKLGESINGTRAMMLATAAMRRTQLRIRELGICFHNYHDWKQTLPAPFITSPDGKPLLSWRVSILPLLGEQKLYEEFHLDEPWDSPHNKGLIERMPDFFLDPRSRFSREEGKSNFLIPVSGGAAFDLADRIKLETLSNMDGTSKTIMIFESDDSHAQIWTDPTPFIYEPEKPATGLYPDETVAVTCDCSIVTIDPGNLDALRDWFSKNGDADRESKASQK